MRGKEYPDILFAAKALGVAANECIVYEDVLSAVKSAKQAGMIDYGVYDKYSLRNRSEIEAVADGFLMIFQNALLPKKKV